DEPDCVCFIHWRRAERLLRQTVVIEHHDKPPREWVLRAVDVLRETGIDIRPGALLALPPADGFAPRAPAAPVPVVTAAREAAETYYVDSDDPAIVAALGDLDWELFTQADPAEGVGMAPPDWRQAEATRRTTRRVPASAHEAERQLAEESA